MPTPSSELPFDVVQNLDDVSTQSNDETMCIAADSGAGGGELIQVVGFQAIGGTGYFDIRSLVTIQLDIAPVKSYNIYNNGTLLVSITDPSDVGNVSAGFDYTIGNLPPEDYNITITGVNSNGEGLHTISVSVTVS